VYILPLYDQYKTVYPQTLYVYQALFAAGDDLFRFIVRTTFEDEFNQYLETARQIVRSLDIK
jgi:hypothetical protein